MSFNRPVSLKILVLTARPLCPVLEESHPVYSIKAVHAVPLSEERATVAVNALLSRTTRNARPSLLPPLDGRIGSEDSITRPETSTRAVKFSDRDEIKVMTPITTRGPFTDPQNDAIYSPTSSSGRSSPGSEISQTGPIERTIASRLAFWNRSTRKEQSNDFSDSYPVDDQDSPLDTVTEGSNKSPAEVLGDIIVDTAPSPMTQEETHNQLEGKIVREAIREFSKGGMYFAYSFGWCFNTYISYVRTLTLLLMVDITRCLQHKRDQVCKAKRHSALLADLNISESGPSSEPSKDGVDPLAEPSPMLPLWRRVDKQFWWNEWLSKRFIDAGVRSQFRTHVRLTDRRLLFSYMGTSSL